MSEMSLIPYDEIERMASSMGKGNLFGKTADQLLPLMLIAQAENKHPAIAAQEYDIIQGRPALRSQAALSRFQASGGRLQWHERSDQNCSATFSHPQSGNVTVDWPFERAVKMGLNNKDNWKKQPMIMLQWRCVAEGVRICFPACLSGLYLVEEVQDFEPVRTVRETTADVSTAPRQSTKPVVTMPTPRQQIPATSEPQPAGLAPVEVISDAQAKRLYALCKKAAVNPDAVKNWLKTMLATDGFHAIPKNRYESICARVEKDPEAFKPFEPATQPAGPTNDDFVALAVEIARENGFDRDAMNQQLFDHFQIGDIRDIPEAKQSTVIDFLNALKETAGA